MKYKYYEYKNNFYKVDLKTEQAFIWDWNDETWSTKFEPIDVSKSKTLNANEAYLFIGEHINAMNMLNK